jgi:hypothetical protein
MAKKTRAVTSGEREIEQPAGVTMAATAEGKLEEFAEDLGRLLGQAQVKAEGWIGQRNAIAQQLAQIRDTAQQWLSDLTGGGRSSRASTQRRRTRPRRRAPESEPQATGRKKRTLSAEARARIAEAQRARWARHRRAAKQG